MSSSHGLRFVAIALSIIFVSDLQAQSFLERDMAAWRRQLDSADARVRRNAAFALGKIGGVGETVALTAVLRNEKDPHVRDAAAFAIGEIAHGDEGAIAALEHALRDPDARVRRSAAMALGALGNKANGSLKALEHAYDANAGDPSVKQNIAWALGRIGVDGAPALRKALRDTDILVRRDAANSLGKIPPAKARTALPELLDCCETRNSELRKAVLVVLASIVTDKDASAIPSLLHALSDPDADVRLKAALTLANIGGDDATKAAVPVLLDALANGTVERRRQAAALLGKFGAGAAAAVPALQQLLNDPDADTRAHAAFALGQIGAMAAGAIPDLVKRIEDKREEVAVRAAAATALAHIGAVPAAVNAVPALLEVLGDPKAPARVRERLVWALRVHNIELVKLNVFPTFEKVLLEKRFSETKMLRYDCAYMLGMLKGPESSRKTLQVLHEWLLDDSVQIYSGTGVSVQPSNPESGGGAATTVDKGAGDGRLMVVRALERIGIRRAVTDVPAIAARLRAMSMTNGLAPDLKKGVDDLLRPLD